MLSIAGENDEFFDARSEDSGRWSVASFRSSSAMLADEPDSQEGSPGPRVSQNPMFDAPSSPNVLDADEVRLSVILVCAIFISWRIGLVVSSL